MTTKVYPISSIFALFAGRCDVAAMTDSLTCTQGLSVDDAKCNDVETKLTIVLESQLCLSSIL